MNKELETELSRLKEKFKISEKEINQLIISNDINKLLEIFSIKLFGSEEENRNLDIQIEKEINKENQYHQNLEKGLVPYFDETLEPVSNEFGCYKCGGYVYEYMNSRCEAECEFEGLPIVYCPKLKCNSPRMCQSLLIPLGLSISEKKYDGSEKWMSCYEIGDRLIMIYDQKIYTFKVVNTEINSELYKLIRKFFDYDLTRKEMNEYILLESVNEIDQNRINTTN